MKKKFNNIYNYIKNNYELIISILYFLVMEILYYFIEFKVMKYVGYFFKFNIEKFIIGWFLYIFTTIIVNKEKEDNIVNVFFTMFLNISIAPFLIIYQFGKANLFMALSQIIALLIMIYLYKIIKKKAPKQIIKNKNIDKMNKKIQNIAKNIKTKNIIYIIFGIISIIAIYFMLKNGLPKFEMINYEGISTIRKNAKFTTIEILLQTISCKILIPLLIAYFIKNKKIFSIIILSIFQLYIFSITGFKTYLFILGLTYIITLCRNFNQKKLIITGLFLIALFTGIIYYYTEEFKIPAITINRFLFFPAQIKWAYLDFFSENPLLLYSQSTIGHILGIKSNYDENIVYMIGKLYFKAPEMWTNTGFIIDAYANLGIFGIIINSIIFSLILYIIELTLKDKKNSIGSIVYILYFLSLNDGGLVYILFSGGLVFAIIFIGLLNYGVSNEKI